MQEMKQYAVRSSFVHPVFTFSPQIQWDDFGFLNLFLSCFFIVPVKHNQDKDWKLNSGTMAFFTDRPVKPKFSSNKSVDDDDFGDYLYLEFWLSFKNNMYIL